MNTQGKAIMNESDLDYYESRLKGMDVPKGRGLLGHHLTCHKGKLVKVELNTRCGRFKTGILLDVGEDYIVLKVGNAPVSSVIPINQIECISFVHSNNKNHINMC